jgi:nucleotide-binding universal stress UspA family protein
MFSKILVGTDGSETAGVAVRQAVELARTTGAELIVLHGCRLVTPGTDVGFGAPIPDPEPMLEAGRAILDEVEKQYAGEVKLRTVLRRGDPAEAVLDAAEEEGADLIVVGNRGMRGARRFLLGSVPDRVSRHAPCSVLIVHTT